MPSCAPARYLSRDLVISHAQLAQVVHLGLEPRTASHHLSVTYLVPENRLLDDDIEL